MTDFEHVKQQIEAAYRDSEEGLAPTDKALFVAATYFHDHLKCTDLKLGEQLTTAVEVVVFYEYLESKGWV